ncbi:MAG: metallophosphoesterase [Myxococcales bacterium]|nr:metallophosphoesterase [Myxococcales bacterium]
MSARVIAFLSDIHIGDNAPTNWYQRDVHEGMLLAAFEHLIARDDLAEVIILGDLIDQWTYVPDRRPPTLEEIAAANPAIFGATGALARLAAHTSLTLLPGNHDMALGHQPGALAKVIGAPVNQPSGVVYKPAAAQGQLVCTHGHIYSMFNAPDLLASPGDGLPIGHFITRLSALHANQQLKAGQTVADLPHNGDPNGLGLLGDAFEQIIVSYKDDNSSLAEVTIRTLVEAVGGTLDLTFDMLDGTRITATEVIARYANLHANYDKVASGSKRLYGTDPGVRALLDTDVAHSIEHFAEVLSDKYTMIVMGHTHEPVDHRDGTWSFRADYVYANSGFNCPSKVDMNNPDKPRHGTFIEVTIDDTARTLSSAVRFVDLSEGTPKVADKTLDTRQIAMR